MVAAQHSVALVAAFARQSAVDQQPAAQTLFNPGQPLDRRVASMLRWALHLRQ